MRKYIVLFFCICFLGLMVQAANVSAAEQPPNLADIQKFAERGVDEAQVMLATMYAYGHGAPQDYAKAAYWYQKAIEQGKTDRRPFSEANLLLSEMYAAGLGVLKNEAKASQLQQKAVQGFKKFAEQGDAYAQCALGGMYVTGKGVVSDRKQGCGLLRKSAEQGFKRGIDLYREFCAK